MLGDVSYVSTYHYQQDGNKVELLHSNGKLNYDRPISQYENAAFPDFVQHGMQAILLQKINEKVQAELHLKLSSQVHQYIQEVFQGHHQQEPVEKVMREGMKNAINGIQQVLSKRGVSSIDLTSNDKEMVVSR